MIFSVLCTLLSLCLLMLLAYRGLSVIVFAPLAALLPVLLHDPVLVLPFFSGVYMDKVAAFLRAYFPLFLLGALFGKLIEAAGFAQVIAQRLTALLGERRAIPAVVLVGALLTYGGVSLFVAAFALYPFAAALFRQAGVPRRLIPGTIALGAFTFTMDALPGSPQIQNLIPTTFFHTTAWAAPRLGTFGALLVLLGGLLYLELRRRQAAARGEGYGAPAEADADAGSGTDGIPLLLAVLPLLLVGLCNLGLSTWLPRRYPGPFDLAAAGVARAAPLDVSRQYALWAVQGALCVGILAVLLSALPRLRLRLQRGGGLQAAVAGALVAAFNTASEYGFGGVIASLPGFAAISGALGRAVSDPLLAAAISTTVLAGITGSASGGMSLALSAMGARSLAEAGARGIPAEVLHRVVAMASGGMDTLPHNGAVITLLLVTGLSHRQAYLDIFAMTLIKTTAVFAVIGAYYAFGLN